MIRELEFALPALLMIVLTHEVGHIVALVGLGVKVEGFSIGLPFRPWLLRLTVRGFTIQVTPWLFSVGPLVRSEVFRRIPPRHNVVVALYGVVAQILVGFLISGLVFGHPTGSQISAGFIRSLTDFEAHAVLAEIVGLYRQDELLSEDVLNLVLAELDQPRLNELAAEIGSATRWEQAVMGGMLLNLEFVVLILLPLPLFDGGLVVGVVGGRLLGRLKRLRE